ncbi:hypothetical protein BBJ28_00001129 [Nothophytophthora sp. Chile5]|nr:hypothetical protein BBJ28_00001129 [Nothophytophthora sp. Chile5]
MPCNPRNCFPGQVFNSRTQKINLNLLIFIVCASSYNEIFFMVDTCQAGSLSNALESPKVVTIGSSQTGENSYAHHSDHELGLSVIDRFTFSTLDYLQRMKVGDSIRNGTLRDLFSFYDPKMLFSTPDYRTDILGRSIDEVPITDFLGSILDVHLHYDDEAYPIEGASEAEPSATAKKSPTISERGAESIGASPPPHDKHFRFSTEFLLGVAAAVLGALIVTTKAV